MIDELAHVGQRRNFMGPVGLRAARRFVEPMYRAFFRDIPETSCLFGLERMVQDGKTFVLPGVPARAHGPPSVVISIHP